MALSQALCLERQQRTAGVRVAYVVSGVERTSLDGQGRGEMRGSVDKIGIGIHSDVDNFAVGE